MENTNVLKKVMKVKARLVLFQMSISPCLKTMHDMMENEIMDDFLTFKNSLFKFVANDFLKGVKQSYGQKVFEALNGTGAHKAVAFSFVTSSCLNYKSHLADNTEIMAFLKNTALSI